jgi:hypothetical protein
MLPGDIVWDFIMKTGRKLEYEEGHVIGYMRFLYAGTGMGTMKLIIGQDSNDKVQEIPEPP